MSSSNNERMPTTYSVAVFHDGEFMFQSDQFTSRNHCKELLDKCSTMDMSNLKFSLYKCSPKGEVVTNEFMEDLSYMTLEKYKGGFLLRPGEDDDRYGQKYFLDGWWIPKHESWFFKPEHADKLIEFGAEYISDLHLVENYSDSDSNADVEAHDDEDDIPLHELKSINTSNIKVIGSFDLTGIHIKTYGKGYMLVPSKSHKDYGKKYYGDGWWNDQQKGWFFRKQSINSLIDAGAVLPPKNPRWKSHHNNDSEVTEYGRGYLMVPDESHPNYGDKYYKNGWWMPSHKGWFFRKQHVDTHTMTVIEH